MSQHWLCNGWVAPCSPCACDSLSQMTSQEDEYHGGDHFCMVAFTGASRLPMFNPHSGTRMEATLKNLRKLVRIWDACLEWTLTGKRQTSRRSTPQQYASLNSPRRDNIFGKIDKPNCRPTCQRVAPATTVYPKTVPTVGHGGDGRAATVQKTPRKGEGSVAVEIRKDYHVHQRANASTELARTP